MTQDEISQLAIELVSQVAADNLALLSFPSKDAGGCPVLAVTSGESVLHFNPYEWAVAIVTKQARQAEFQLKGDVEAQKTRIAQEATQEIVSLLFTVHLSLGEILEVLRNLSTAALIDEELGPFFRDIQINIKWRFLRIVDGRFRKLLGLPEKSEAVAQAERDEMVGGNYDYAITDKQMLAALKKLERFSIKGLAKLLAPERDDFRKSVYDWMHRKGIDRVGLEAWWRKVRGGVE